MAVLFKGYAIVSADGFIADDRGQMPDALRIEADWDYFQAALDAADVTLLGRLTHEAAPNIKGRRRLVVSRGVHAVVQENASTWWANPKQVTPASAALAVQGPAANVAVVGGTGVFGWILEEGCYDSFHLSVAHDVRLGTGRPLFDHADGLEGLEGLEGLDGATARLVAAGMAVIRRSWLDRDAGLELVLFGHAAR